MNLVESSLAVTSERNPGQLPGVDAPMEPAEAGGGFAPLSLEQGAPLLLGREDLWHDRPRMNVGVGEAEVRLRPADICEGQPKSAKNVLGLASTEAKQENRAIASFANRQGWMTVAVPVDRARAMPQPLAGPDAPRPGLPADFSRIDAALRAVRPKLSGCYSVRCHGRPHPS
jgi:hypothetical protein